MGREVESHRFAADCINAWSRELEAGADAVVINASGCGTTVKDYGHMFRNEPLAPKAEMVSAKTQDISEFLTDLGFPSCPDKEIRVGYHSACSLQHGQKVTALPAQLLKKAGFKVVLPAEGHLCCGSAGTYNILQPQIAEQLKERKVQNFEAISPDVIAAGNIGCMMQIDGRDGHSNRPYGRIARLGNWWSLAKANFTAGNFPGGIRALPKFPNFWGLYSARQKTPGFPANSVTN